jgi:hypothetical protein
MASVFGFTDCTDQFEDGSRLVAAQIDGGTVRGGFLRALVCGSRVPLPSTVGQRGLKTRRTEFNPAGGGRGLRDLRTREAEKGRSPAHHPQNQSGPSPLSSSIPKCTGALQRGIGPTPKAHTRHRQPRLPKLPDAAGTTLFEERNASAQKPLTISPQTVLRE